MNDASVSCSLSMPQSPRCLAMFDVSKHSDHLSGSFIRLSEKACQTRISALANSHQTIDCETLTNIITKKTNCPSKIDRQIQVNTCKHFMFEKLQSSMESTDDPLASHHVLAAVIDKDGTLAAFFS